MMGRDLKVTLLLALLAAGGLACSDDRSDLVAPHGGTNAPGGGGPSRAVLSCHATVNPMRAVCTPVGGAPSVESRMRHYVVVGKQAVYVNLVLSNFAFSTVTDTFSFSATVQNLMTQPIGTQDGSTIAGHAVAAFFTAGPSSESGSGTVTLGGDSIGTFTATNQPFYKYNQIIKPDSTSAAVTWKFHLSAGVTSFNFFVEVAADMPAEGSVLRWTSIRQGISSNQLNAVWQANASNVFAVGLNGTVLYYNGTTWSQLLNASGYRARGVTGSSPTDVWIVADSGITGHYNGSTFSNVATPSAANLKGAFEISPTNIYAVGGGGGVSIMFQSNGTTWTNIAAPHGVVDTLRAVWASDASHIFVVGDAGRIMMWSGSAWTQFARPTGNPPFRGVWGTSATNVFAVATNGSIWQYNGTTWASMTSPVTTELDAIGGSSGSDIWAVGSDGVTLHYNGTAWSSVAPVVGLNLHGVTSGTTSPVWAVGDDGALVQYNGTSWSLSTQSGIPIKRIWASSATDVWASTEGTVLHFDGTNWTTYSVSAADTMVALFGFSSTDVHTLGQNGSVAIYTGTWATGGGIGGSGWTDEWGTTDTTLCAVGAAGEWLCNQSGGGTSSGKATGTPYFTSLWGTARTNQYAGATNGIVYHTTSALPLTWTAQTTNTTDTIFAVWGTSATAVWAVGQAGKIIANTGTNTWTAQTSGTSNDLYGLWADTAPTGYTADVYAVGGTGTIVHYNGTEWSSMWSGVTSNLRAVFGTSATNVYVGGDNGVVLVGSQ
jgi:hypothetical protein